MVRERLVKFVKVGCLYDCSKCPGYCCSYPVIELKQRDVDRLARHFGITPEQARKKYTRKGHGHEMIMRRKEDEHFGRICQFFDTEKRNCGVYKARPGICRRFPQEKRCGYYDFLTWERRHQDDPDYVATTDNGHWK